MLRSVLEGKIFIINDARSGKIMNLQHPRTMNIITLSKSIIRFSHIYVFMKFYIDINISLLHPIYLLTLFFT